MATAFKSPDLRPSSEEIREQVGMIVISPAFQGSRRCRQFLEYVCEKSLAGDLGSLKERAIAIEVFGRRPQSDLAEDTIVRVGAREVRKRLAAYYGTPEGAAAPVRVDLPSGCYAPDFRYASQFVATPQAQPAGAPAAVTPAALPAVVEPVAPQIALAPPTIRSRIRISLAVAGAVALVVLAYFAGRASQKPVTNATFERFWGPVLAARTPLLLAVGHPLVYHPSRRALDLNDKRLPLLPFPAQRPLMLEPNEMNGADMIPVQNQYVGFGDMVVATSVAGMLAARSKELVVRMASSISFADLRQSPALLIGAMTNRWTMELGQTWRFRFDRRDIGNLIVDTASPGASRHWAVPHREDGGAREDYLLISRLMHSSTGPVLVVAAGIKQFGTEAAGHLLSDPGKLEAVLSQLPSGWDQKNLQVVLRVQVIANTPATPEVVASHTW